MIVGVGGGSSLRFVNLRLCTRRSWAICSSRRYRGEVVGDIGVIEVVFGVEFVGGHKGVVGSIDVGVSAGEVVVEGRVESVGVAATNVSAVFLQFLLFLFVIF